MPVEEKYKSAPTHKLHTLVMENREKLTLSGVEEVDSFDENVIILRTNMGVLTVKGSQLHISLLSVETKDVNLEGHIDSLVYTSESSVSKKGFFSGLFK